MSKLKRRPPARVDLLLEEDEALVLRDYKTSRTRWNAAKLECAAEQSLLYHELVRPLSPTMLPRLEFAVLTKTKCPAVEVHVVEPGQPRVAPKPAES